MYSPFALQFLDPLIVVHLGGSHLVICARSMLSMIIVLVKVGEQMWPQLTQRLKLERDFLHPACGTNAPYAGTSTGFAGKRHTLIILAGTVCLLC